MSGEAADEIERLKAQRSELIAATGDEIKRLRAALESIQRLDTATDEFGFVCAKDIAKEALAPELKP